MKRLVFLIAMIFPSLAYGQNLEWKGFADVQYQLNHGLLEDLTVDRARKENSFLVNQGALYLSSTKGNAKFLLDLPFRSSAASTQNTFRFAEGFAQAWVNLTVGDNWQFKLGQFDTPYGFEGNDTTDILFTNQGIVFAILPVTHMGLLVSKSFGEISLDLLFGNGQQNTPTAVDNNSNEAGVKVSWTNAMYRARVGALLNAYDGEYTAGAETEDRSQEMLMDVGFGGTWGAVAVDLAYDSRSALGGEDKTGAGEDKDPTTGILAQVSYGWDDHTFAVRHESTDNYDAEAGAYTADTTSTKTALGYQHLLKNENLKLKAELASNSVDDGTESESYMTGALGAIFNF